MIIGRLAALPGWARRRPLAGEEGRFVGLRATKGSRKKDNMHLFKRTYGWTLAATLFAVIAAAQEPAAEETSVGSVTVEAASTYVFRGATLNRGLVLQPALEVEALPGLTLGVWANLDLDDNDGALKKGEFSEVDLTVTYSREFENVSLSLGYIEYQYPGAAADADREVSLSIELPLALSPTLTANYGVDGAVQKSLYLQAGIGHELSLTDYLTLSLGATVGYAVPDQGDSGFGDYSISAGIGMLKYFTLKVAYISQIDDAVLTDAQYDRELVVSLSGSRSF